MSFIRSLRVLAGLALLTALPAFAADAHGMHGGGAKAREELGSSAAFAPDGQLFAVARQGGHLLLYRSGDQGLTWAATGIVNPVPETISADGENRPKLAFTADGGLLVSWTHPLAKPYTGEIHLARSDDRQHFSAPIVVHRNRDEITHRFDTLLVVPDGRVVVAWIDKRDLEAAKAAGKEYSGAAIYAAVSRDGGRSFAPERKVADHACECCRIAAAVDTDGAPVLLWREVFPPNERDHAITRLDADGRPGPIVRATFDRWRIDGCPHHGPSLAIDARGVRHAVWFDVRDGSPHVFYGRLPATEGGSVQGQIAVGSGRAEHADLALAGDRLAIVWKEFDGKEAKLMAQISNDGGQSFETPTVLAATAGDSDQPRALGHGGNLFAFWNTEREGMRLFPLR